MDILSSSSKVGLILISGLGLVGLYGLLDEIDALDSSLAIEDLWETIGILGALSWSLAADDYLRSYGSYSSKSTNTLHDL